MQKKRKILISIALSVGLALTATQVSNNRGLQSNTLAAALYSCKSGAITSAERCQTPLTTDKARVEREIAVLARNIQTKKTECSALRNRKRPQTLINSCTKQLTNLEKNSTTKKRELTALTLSLSKLVSEAPLQVRVVNVQREINTVRAQIVTKTAECGTLRTQRKTAQMNACVQQLTALRQTETTKKKELTVAKESLKKVAGVTSIIVKIPAPAPTPAPTQSATPPVLNAAPVQRAPTQPVTNANTETVIPPIASITSTASTPTPVASPVPITTEATSTSLRPTITVLNTANTPTPTTVVTISAPPVVTPPVAAIRPNNTPSNPGAFIGQGMTPSPVSTSTAPVTPNNPPQTPQSSTPLIINDRYPVTAPFSPKCTDPNATNMGGSLPCLYDGPPPECMAPLMLANDGSCRYDGAQTDQYCTDPNAHNYIPLFVITSPDFTGVPNLPCQTCNDGIMNGDESYVDCGGKCGSQNCKLGCTNGAARNHDPLAVIDDSSCIIDDYAMPPREICKDDKADNYEEGEVNEPDTVNNDVCIYCDLPKKTEEIRNKQGAKVKTSLSQLNQEDKDACKKQICESGSVELSQCTIATEFKPHFAYLQMYLVLAGEDPGTLDGIYRSSKEITLTPTATSNTRKALAQHGSNVANINEIKKCSFVKDLLEKELIKDYEPENTDKIKVTQMALTMLDKYSGSIDGNKDTTYNALQKHYVWDTKKFGYAYIAGANKKWQVGRSTRFGYNDSGDNGRGTPFIDPAGKGISTNNTSIQGASLPLPVTVKMLCPNIIAEVSRYVDFAQRGFESPKPIPLSEYTRGAGICAHMLNSADPLNPSSNGNLSGLGVLTECITIANKSGFTSCRDIHHTTTVKVSSIGKEITVPLVDIGPSEAVWNGQKEAVIDLTYGAMKAISGGEVPGTNYETCFQLIPGKATASGGSTSNT